MTARIAIERADIVKAALAIIREKGWEGVSARSLAARLGSSTMPIYSGMGSMEELRLAAEREAESMLLAEQGRPRTGDPRLDMAVGYVAFAREEPEIFHFAIASRGRGQGSGMASPEQSLRKSEERGAADTPAMREAVAVLADPARRTDFVLRSWVFTHGLAELLALGAFPMSDEEIARHLAAAGGAFYALEIDAAKGEG
jgi:AcrR family transcriptional regulator